MKIYGVYSPHERYWRPYGAIWHTEHLNLAYAECDRVRSASGKKSWEVCVIGKYGRPDEIKEELAE